MIHNEIKFTTKTEYMKNTVAMRIENGDRSFVFKGRILKADQGDVIKALNELLSQYVVKETEDEI